MLSSKNFKAGDLNGVIYDFKLTGDILPKHNHGEYDVHITIVARGRVKAYSHDWETEVPTGGLIDFKAGEPHEIMALEDNTRIFNIVKKMVPEIDYLDGTNLIGDTVV
jgi:quercetin dioxygenase-like cupin family protein